MTQAANPKLMRILQIVVGGLLAFLVLIMVLSVLGGRALEEEQQEAEAEAEMAALARTPSVATASPAIRSTSVEGDDLTVDVLIDGAWDDADYPLQTAVIVEEIGKAVQAGAQDVGSASRLVLKVAAPSADRLGRNSEVVLYTVFFDVADLRAAQFENLSYGRTLELSTGVSVGRAGLDVMAAYCATDRGRQQSPRFCTPA